MVYASSEKIDSFKFEADLIKPSNTAAVQTPWSFFDPSVNTSLLFSGYWFLMCLNSCLTIS